MERLIRIKKRQEDEGRAFLEVISNRVKSMSDKLNTKRMGGWNGTWGATNSVLNSLLSTGDITKIQNDSLKYLLSNWTVDVKRYEDQEKRHEEAFLERSKYLTNKHYGPIVKQGDYSTWPGSFYPNDLDAINDKLIPKYINDIEYYNLTRIVISRLHIQLLNAKTLTDNYGKISKLLVKELENRGIDQSQGSKNQ